MSDYYRNKGEKTIKKTKHFFPDSGIVHFGERLKEAMNGESTLSFAKRCGLSEGTVRKYINGLSYPAIDKIPSISKACGKDIEWLVTGKNGDSSNSNESERLVMSDAEIHEWWAVICKSLQPKELKHVISVFKRHGVSAIFKDEILQQEQSEEKQLKDREILTSNQSESPGYHLSQSSINTAEILHKLTAEQRREILRKYEIDEGDSKNTINQTVTQHKKEAS